MFFVVFVLVFDTNVFFSSDFKKRPSETKTIWLIMQLKVIGKLS